MGWDQDAVWQMLGEEDDDEDLDDVTRARRRVKHDVETSDLQNAADLFGGQRRTSSNLPNPYKFPKYCLFQVLKGCLANLPITAHDSSRETRSDSLPSVHVTALSKPQSEQAKSLDNAKSLTSCRSESDDASIVIVRLPGGTWNSSTNARTRARLRWTAD